MLWCQHNCTEINENGKLFCVLYIDKVNRKVYMYMNLWQRQRQGCFYNRNIMLAFCASIKIFSYIHISLETLSGIVKIKQKI